MIIACQVCPDPLTDERLCDLNGTNLEVCQSENMLIYIPIGVVSKKVTGDRKTPLSAALNRRRLAYSPTRLEYSNKLKVKCLDLEFRELSPYLNVKLVIKDKTA